MKSRPAQADISLSTHSRVRRVKQADGLMIARKAGPAYRSVMDPTTGRRWTWKESEFPGLFAFLGAFVRKWQRPVIVGTASLKGRSTGGVAAAKVKKAAAKSWKDKIERKVKRLIQAGKTDVNIGVILASEAGRASRTVAAFSAELRKKSAE